MDAIITLRIMIDDVGPNGPRTSEAQLDEADNIACALANEAEALVMDVHLMANPEA